MLNAKLMAHSKGLAGLGFAKSDSGIRRIRSTRGPMEPNGRALAFIGGGATRPLATEPVLTHDSTVRTSSRSDRRAKSQDRIRPATPQRSSGAPTVRGAVLGSRTGRSSTGSEILETDMRCRPARFAILLSRPSKVGIRKET